MTLPTFSASDDPGPSFADLLRLTLDELKCPNLKVNFDPANMLLYDKDDPLAVIDLLAPDIRSVHVKDATRPPRPGVWGDEVPLGTGQTNTAGFVRALKRVGYRGPRSAERSPVSVAAPSASRARMPGNACTKSRSR